MTKADVIKKRVFWSSNVQDFNTYFETLYRLAQGSRSKAYEVIRETAKHFTVETYTDFELDCIIGELNNGVEVEWSFE